MNSYTYQNDLVGKKQLRQLLSWSFTKYGSVYSCFLADELKYLGFKYATQAGISISIEDLKVPFIKTTMLQKANKDILGADVVCLKGKITNVERFQKIIDTWNLTSESLKTEVVSYFKRYDPLNSVYMMAFSGSRGNLSQVRQLVGMRGLMSDPSGEILNLPIKKNFREGLTITDYLMSGYGARKGIVDTALKTANSGYLTRRLIDVAQDIIIREKDCLTAYSFLIDNFSDDDNLSYNQVLGHLLNKPIYDLKTNELISDINSQITPDLIHIFKQKNIQKFYIRSPLTCCLYRSICQKCYGWNLARESLVDIGDAVGIIAGQSIGEPGTQLTMRTFHTGGIFTAAANQQLISPINGLIQFSKFLRTSTIRTNRGENVLLTENSGFLLIIPTEINKPNSQIELPRNAILFSKDKKYVKKGTIIGQLLGALKQTRTEIKPILSDYAGEIYMPKLSKNLNLISINKLLWILSGQVYQAPLHSFLNFYQDYKINKNSYLFRSKIINKRPGFMKLTSSNNLFGEFIEIKNNSYFFANTTIFKLLSSINKKNFLLKLNSFKYLINLQLQNFKIIIPTVPCFNFGTLITKNFNCLTGGTLYYTQDVNRNNESFSLSKIHFYSSLRFINLRSIIWLGEEIYKMNCDNSFLFVENDNFIPEKFELTTNIFSKTSGIVTVKENKQIVKEIIIKSGLLYEVYNINSIKKFNKQVFYPGEIILEDILITQPSLIEIIERGLSIKLLIRPLDIYEIPLPKSINFLFGKNCYLGSTINLTNTIDYLYESKQKIKETKHLNLVEKLLKLNTTNCSKEKNKLKIELALNLKNPWLKFIVSEKLCLSNYIPAYLKYCKIQFCLITENNQFINSYSILGYLETISQKSLKLIKFKSKSKKKKQLFLISNDDCLIIPKNNIKIKTNSNFLINQTNIQETGKILIKNKNLITIQKGRPYFFPNCKNDDFIDKTVLEYKIISSPTLLSNTTLSINKCLNIHSYNIGNKLLTFSEFVNKNSQYTFSKMIIKKKGKFYITGLPVFLREILIKRRTTTQKSLVKLKQKFSKLQRNNLRQKKKEASIMFVQNSELDSNLKFEFASLLLMEYPFTSLGIHSITEDYLEREINLVYCQNGDFIEVGQPIGLLNYEKEITGDIVQGLPRIEELLEARKNKKLSKFIPKNRKKGLLIRKTSLDSSFEFRKLGTTIKNDEKINPHNLLKVYFNYYAKIKTFVFQTRILQLFRLSKPYEASYRSFKKIQSLILNSVQSVYQSQGVTIADKHLEIVIKQMTSKVQITRAGDTPLLPHEVIDLYHINYINEIIQQKKKQPAYYVPLLLGVTKASLNNPSFISAASFQETTRVLTKAAIEGKRDWLRGLKENIVIGQLIPVGTSSKTYSNFFGKELLRHSESKIYF